jgi:tRNA pseudouridine55 synthase
MSDGFLIVNKVGGLTSHDVVAKARKKLQTKKIGHAGTLDPMATGVLVLGVGIGTRLLNFIVGGRKSYEGTIRLGANTTTDDKEGEVLNTFDTSSIADEAITAELNKFVGKIMQKPTSVSAIKIDGKSAHERVRAGEEVDIPARPVEIFHINIKSINRVDNFIDIEIEVACSAGTYIRSIARDLGQALKNGGHLIKLNRSEVAPFTSKDAALLEDAELIPISEGLSRILPPRNLTPEEEREIFFGRAISPSQNEVTAAYKVNGDFAALLTNKVEGGKNLSFPSLVNVKE